MPTPTELKTEIQTGPLAAELAPHVTAGDHIAIAGVLNRPDYGTIVYQRMVNFRTVMAEIDPVTGASILDKLEAAASTVSAIKWALYGIKSDTGIDVGHPATRAQIDALVAGGVLTSTEGAQLKSLAERMGSRAEALWGAGTVITHEQVAEALRS